MLPPTPASYWPVADADLHELAVLAVEGPARLLPDLDRWLADDREVLLRTIRQVESASALLGISPHLHLAGRAES
jgi:hypothetical protein